MSNDLDFMKQAIEESRKCKPEDNRIHPHVGVVVVNKDGTLMESSFRGELAKGDHAEFTVMEKKLSESIMAGSSVYTTLEPCTTRNHPKVPCAERLIERKVERVFIGILDPNPLITGKGVRRLREANITVEMFSPTLVPQIEELNRDFIRYHSDQEASKVSEEWINQSTQRSLDDWYRKINQIYWNQNFLKDPSVIFTHLVEVVGGLSALASHKRKPGIIPEGHIVKAFAWWLALCGKIGVKSVEDMLWDKFPSVCPYCQEEVHNPDICSEMKKAKGGPQWDVLVQIGKNKKRPKRISEWQRMYSKIYPAQQTEDYALSFGRLAEELGELAEAIRIFRAAPGYFLSEACDVFAWLMHIQNIVDSKAEVPMAKRGNKLEVTFSTSYPDGCTGCRKGQCTCPPILPATIGRIAHEVPSGRGSFRDDGRFMTPDVAMETFLYKPSPQ